MLKLKMIVSNKTQDKDDFYAQSQTIYKHSKISCFYNHNYFCTNIYIVNAKDPLLKLLDRIMLQLEIMDGI